jgi:hypothetical protein
MYRSQSLALTTHVDALRGDLDDLRASLAAAEAARAEALAELERVRDGVELDPDLEKDARYRRLLSGLRVLVVVALLGLVIAIVPLLSALVADPLLTPQGWQNLVFHVVHGRGLVGIAAAGFVVAIASPWIVVPILAVRGLRRHRRAGWMLAVASAWLWLPTPLLPLALWALVTLHSSRIRAVYFAR